ncbi:Uncharacterised protein [Streptococcus pneumoniae]|nr:Uncharacterised protein [Streptococcus pneumoniae]
MLILLVITYLGLKGSSSLVSKLIMPFCTGMRLALSKGFRIFANVLTINLICGHSLGLILTSKVLHKRLNRSLLAV